MPPKVIWNDLFKIRLSTKVDESMDKHDIIKLLLVRKILRTYRKRHFIRIYTEFKLNGSGLVPDVYMENIKTKSVIAYEIQKEISKEYIQNRTERYSKVVVPFFNTIDLVIIPLKECPDNISEINKWLEDFVM